MNINELTIGEAKELAALFSGSNQLQKINSGLVGKYVIVRCRDAGVHAGFLESHSGRECVLLNARRLWYWKPGNKQKFLSGVAIAGLSDESKVGAPVSRILLTENCEIIEVESDAVKSIRDAKVDERE